MKAARSGVLGPALVGVLVTGQVAHAGVEALPTLGLGAGALREGPAKDLSFLLDVFLGADVRWKDEVPGLGHPAVIARAHVLLGGTSRFEPRLYLVAHSGSLRNPPPGGDSAVALGFGPSLPLVIGKPVRISPALFVQATWANLLSFEVGARFTPGPLDLSAAVQFDIAYGLLYLGGAAVRD